MADIGTDTAVASYLASVRTALTDLPATEVGEILDDIGPHVAEVAAELGPDDQPGRLHERLGTPEQYAAELRAAAGYPPRVDAPPAAAATRQHTQLRLALWLLAAATVPMPLFAMLAGGEEFVLWGVLATLTAGLSLYLAVRAPGGIAAMAELSEIRWLRDRNPGGVVAEYGRLFQPGWWLVRAGVAATVIVLLVDGRSVLAILLLMVPLALGSAWVGRRSQADRRLLWVVLPLNAFAFAFGLYILSQGAIGTIGYAGYNGPSSGPPTPQFGNVYPYDSNGKPLTGVYLYDENGRPITSEYSLSYCTPPGRVLVPANQYPQPEYEHDYGTGECVVRSVVPVPPTLPSAQSATSVPSGPSATSVPTSPDASTTALPGAPPAAPTTTK